MSAELQRECNDVWILYGTLIFTRHKNRHFQYCTDSMNSIDQDPFNLVDKTSIDLRCGLI